MRTLQALLLAALMWLPAVGNADTLRLRDGRVITGVYEGGSSRVVRFRTTAGLEEYDVLTVAGIRVTETGAASPRENAGDARAHVDGFAPDEQRIIRTWFSDRSNLSGLPPGLARRDSLPPGLQRQIQKNGTLPPGLQRRLHPLPYDLERRLPGLPTILGRVILGRDVLLLDTTTSRIVDVLRGVF